MKKIILIFILSFFIFISTIHSSLPLSGKLIIIDAGHGSKDVGTSYNDILEKDLNLNISKKIEEQLIMNGASVILVREGDYDLSSPNSKKRKRSDFNNRIEYINNSNADIYLYIHINYLNDKKYNGAQVFYNKDKNKKLANTIQMELNKITTPRAIKKTPNVYMYDKLKIKGVLIECGFLSNYNERNKLINDDYQTLLSKMIVDGIIKYFT